MGMLNKELTTKVNAKLAEVKDGREVSRARMPILSRQTSSWPRRNL
jgi:hypothetical protein